jgi:hypothetical protein
VLRTQASVKQSVWMSSCGISPVAVWFQAGRIPRLGWL